MTLLAIALLAAQPAAAPAPVAPPPPPMAQLPRELTDPATANKLANVMQALSHAFLNLPVGEVQAAVEGRPATPADKRLKVRDLARRDDPNFDRDFQRQMAATKPMIQSSMRALATALPQMMQGLQQASQAIERAAANMPDPTYPKR
jgi:hypothetical protein